MTSPFVVIVLARSVRAFGFGLLSVAFALYLGERGLSPFAVGAALTLALLAGAGFLTSTPAIVQHFGTRLTLCIAATAMCIGGVVLGMPGPMFLIFVACLSGTLSAGGQEVGPFAAIEQHVVSESTAARSQAYAFSAYNLYGAFALALGALAASALPTPWTPWAYASCGLALLGIYAVLPETASSAAPQPVVPKHRFGAAERLAVLFGADALAGGFVVQSFLAYWLHLRFGADQRVLGFVLFGANTLAALSYPVAAWLSARIGLLRTMVFTHLPSNVLLLLVPLMPTFDGAAIVLLARFALSQMDVPTRQALTMTAVAPHDRVRAAALTNAVRPASAAIAPIFSGLAMQTAAMGLPFFIAGGLKIVYDLTIFQAFRRSPEESR